VGASTGARPPQTCWSGGAQGWWWTSDRSRRLEGEEVEGLCGVGWGEGERERRVLSGW
jgi:hypothetical protein